MLRNDLSLDFLFVKKAKYYKTPVLIITNLC